MLTFQRNKLLKLRDTYRTLNLWEKQTLLCRNFLPYVRNSLKCYLKLLNPTRSSQIHLSKYKNRTWRAPEGLLERWLVLLKLLPLLAMIKNLLWNIRGIGNIKSRRRVAKLVKMYNISFIAILEPLHHANKIQEFSNRIGFHFSLANQEADDKINMALLESWSECSACRRLWTVYHSRHRLP